MGGQFFDPNEIVVSLDLWQTKPYLPILDQTTLRRASIEMVSLMFVTLQLLSMSGSTPGADIAVHFHADPLTLLEGRLAHEANGAGALLGSHLDLHAQA